MAAEGGVLETISEKIVQGEIGNIRFDHIPNIEEAEGSPEHAYDNTSIKTEVSEPVSLQSLKIVGDGQSQTSPAATHDNGIINDKAKDENSHLVTAEIVDNTEGQIFNEAPSGVQISLEENCKDIVAGFQEDSHKEGEKDMPESAKMNPIASDEHFKEGVLGSDKGKEDGTVSEVQAKSLHDVNVIKDEGEDNEGMTEHGTTEKKTSESEISEQPTSEIGVKLTEVSQAEHEDISPGFTDAIKDADQEPLTRKEETDKVDLVTNEEPADSTLQNSEIISDSQRVTSLDNTETTENDGREFTENQNLKQDVNTEAEERPKTHELTSASIEERVGEGGKPKESFNAALEEPEIKTQDANEEQEETTEGDISAQRFATELQHLQLPTEKCPMPSTTELPGSTEEQDEETEEGEASAQSSARQLPHLQSSMEKSPVHISTPLAEQVAHDATVKTVPALSEETVGENDMLKESSDKESRESGTETQYANEVQDKTTEEGDVSAQLSVSELQHLPIEKSPLPSKTEDELDIDGAKELSPDYAEDQVREEVKLEESSNVESGEPGTQTQDSTKEQEAAEEKDISDHVSTVEHLSIENPAVRISTSTTEAQLQEGDVKELEPALTEDRMGENEKLIETSNVASEEPATATEDHMEEQEKSIEGDASVQKSVSEELHLPLQIEKYPVPSTTEDQLEIDDAQVVAPGFTKEHVREEENLKESTIETEEPGTEAQHSTEEQDKETEEGDASVETSASELPHLQFSIETPLEGIRTSTTEARLTEDDVKESVPALTENRIEEDEQLAESSDGASEEPVTETQGSAEEQEKATEEGGASAQKSASEEPHLQLKIEKFPVPSTIEHQLVIEDARELAPGFTEEHMREEEKLKESSHAESEEPGTDTQDSTEEQDKETEEVDASGPTSAGELPHLQLSTENSLVDLSTSTTEAQLVGDDARELLHDSTEDKMGEDNVLIESIEAASEQPAIETQKEEEEQEKATAEGEALAQMSASEQQHLQLEIEKSETSSTTEDQLKIDDARELATGITKEQAREEDELKESSHAEPGEIGTQTQSSTEEQDKGTEQEDASAHMSSGELPHLQLSKENPPVHASSSTEAQLPGVDARELSPALTEDRMGDDEKLTQSSDVASKKPGNETQDSVNEEEKASEEGDTQKSPGEAHLQLQIENSPIPSTTADQLETDEAKTIASSFTEEEVNEHEKLKVSSDVVSGDPCTEMQDSTEEQNKEKEDGDVSVHVSADELSHSSIENPSAHISPSTAETQVMGDDARESATALTENGEEEDEKLKESSNEESGEPGIEIQYATDEQEKITEERDASAQLSVTELHHLTTEKSLESSKTEDQFDIDGARELAPNHTEDQVRGEQETKESSNVETGEPGTRTQDLTEEQEETEEGDVSADMPIGEHLPVENLPVCVTTSTAEAQLREDDVKELAPDSMVDRMGEDEKLIETSNAAPEEPTTETEDSVDEQEKAIEERDASLQKSVSEELHLALQIEKSLVPSSTEAQHEKDGARELAPNHTEDQVRGEQKTKESSNVETGEPGTQTQDLTEEKEETEEGDISAQVPLGEHLPVENLPVRITTSTAKAQLPEDEVKELAPDSTADRMGEDKKPIGTSNAAPEEPTTETEDSVEEQEKAIEEGDASLQKSVSEELRLPLQIEKSPGPSTTEAQHEKDDAGELAPDSMVDRMGEDEKLIETSNAEPEEPTTKTEDSVEEQEKAIEEGDASLQKSASEELHLPLQIEKSPVPSTTEAQHEKDDAGELAPGFTEEHAREEENLKESSDVETGEPGTEARDSTEKQNKGTEEGDASVEISASELAHLQFSVENPPVGIRASATEAQLTEDDVKDSVHALTKNRIGEDEKLTESSGVASGEPVAETHGTVEQQEKASEEDDPSAQKSDSEVPQMQLSIEKSTEQTTEAQFEIDDTRELAPALIEESVPEQENLKESSNVDSGETGTETQGSTEEQEQANEGGFTSVQKSASEMHHLQLSDVAFPKNSSASATEAKSETDDLGDDVPPLNARDEDSLITSTGTITQETIPDPGMIQQKYETENIVLMTSTQEDVSEVKHAELIPGIETPSDVIAMENVDDLPEDSSERETLQVDNEEATINEEASDPHPREEETVAEKLETLLNPSSEKTEATETETESTGNEQFIKNAEENSQEKEAIYENIKDVTSESIPGHQQSDNATGELGGKIGNFIDDNEVNQMIAPLPDPNQCINAAILRAEDNSNNQISSNMDNVKDAGTVHDAVDDKQEKVPGSISEEVHEFANINENIETGMEATDELGTISEPVPEEQNKETLFSASNIKTENIPEADAVDNKTSEKVDLEEHAENAERNLEANFSKNLADNPSINADVHEDKVECTEKHEIMSELIPEKQNQAITGELETPEVEKRAYDEKDGPVSRSESLIEASLQKDETSTINVEESEKAQTISEKIPEKQDQHASETKTTEAEKRTYDEISGSLSSAENLIADNMQNNELPMFNVEEHDDESSKMNEILENKLSEDGKNTNGAISGPSTEEKVASSVFDEAETKELGVCLNQSEVETENISLREETLYQTSDYSTVGEKLGTHINGENGKSTIDEEETSGASNSVNIDRDQNSKINEKTVMKKDADSHEKIKDSNIPTKGHDFERKADIVSSAEAETEPALEEDKIVITQCRDIEDITTNAEEQTEKKLDTFHPSSLLVDEGDLRNQKGDQMESENESNVSARDRISNEKVESYLASKEQNLETIAEIDIAKTKAAEDENKELGESPSNVADDSIVEEPDQEMEKQKDVSPVLSDKIQVPESTDGSIGMDLDLLKGNSETVDQLEKPAILESEDQSDKHITEIEIIKSDIAEGISPALQDSTEEKIDETYNLPEDNSKSLEVKESEVTPVEEAKTTEEAVFAASMQSQGIVDDKINEDNRLECEEDAETAEDQENAMVEEAVCLNVENDNQESTPVCVFDAAETTKEEDAYKVTTEEIDTKDARHEESPGSKIDDLSINHNLEEETLKGEASSPLPKVDNMEPVIFRESEVTCESIFTEYQEVHAENESLEEVSIKDPKEHNQLEEHLGKLSERAETTSSIGEIEKEMIEKDASSEIHETTSQRDEIAIEHMETGTETQDTPMVTSLESEVKESDTVSVSATSNEKPENDLAISSSQEESAAGTMPMEPESATEKTNRAEGVTESAAVSETITANDSTDGNNVISEDISNGSISDTLAEDTIDTEIKEKIAEKEAIAENTSTSANDIEDKNLPASSFMQATQVALPRDADEVVVDVAEASRGVEESDNLQQKESQQSTPDDLPVSQFLMDHILNQGDVSDEGGNVESDNKIEKETTGDKHMIRIQEQQIVMDPLSAEMVPNENITENKDVEKLEATILPQDNVPDEVCDVDGENKIKQENTTDEQKHTGVQEKEAITDSVSAEQIPEEKKTSEDMNQEKPEGQILHEGIVPDEVCDVKAANIIIEENANDKNEGISIKEQEVTMGPLPDKEILKNEEDVDKVEVASIANEEQSHETKEDAENPVAKDNESSQRNICLSFTTKESELVEIEVPGSLKGTSASMVPDDHKEVTPTIEPGDLGSEESAEEFTSPTSVRDEKITASPTETNITENSTQKIDYSPATNASDVSIPRDGENTRDFDNGEQIDKDAHSISEEQITSATSELLGSTTSMVRSEEPQTNTKYEETNVETIQNIEENQVEVTEKQVQHMSNDSFEEPEESTSQKVQLFDLLILSRNKTTQKTTPTIVKDGEEVEEATYTEVKEETTPTITKDGGEAEEATYTKVKEEKTDEKKHEKVEEEEEHKTDDHAGVIVESRDAELKPAHKKSHNILSGVGSKVKHSIAKVKKAITGKSSHQKTISAKKATI